MKLVYIVKRFPKVSETFILREVEELIRHGDDVTLCSLRRPPANDPWHPGAEDLARQAIYVPRAPHPRLLGAALLTLAAVPRHAWPTLGWSIKQAIRSRKLGILEEFGEAAYLRTRIPADTDHIHAHYADVPARVAMLLSRLTGRPFSFTVHAYDIFERIPEDLQEKLATARFVAAVSRYTREYVARLAAPESRANVVVVRNGISRELFPPRPREPRGVPHLLTVSRLVEKKGLDTLVDACALLASRELDFRCEVLGGGELKPRLEDRARALDVADRISFLGSREYGDVRAAYERASVFVLPCQRTETGDRDGLPVALTEAMAIGVPVVTTPVSGIPEVVRDGESGLLVPQRDPVALAAAVQRILADAELRGTLTEGGRGAVAEFGLDQCVAVLRSLFREGPRALEATDVGQLVPSAPHGAPPAALGGGQRDMRPDR